MAIVARNLTGGRVVYWIATSWQGKVWWERSGTSKRTAERLDETRKAEVKKGTFTPQVKDGRHTVGSYLRAYLATRTNRSKQLEIDLIGNHVMPVEEFVSMRLDKVRPKDCLALVNAIRKAGRLGEKSISTVYAIVRGAFRQAVFEELIAEDPSALPKKTLRYKTASANKRTPYTRAEALLFTRSPKLLPSEVMWNCLALYTGMREGEVCGRRFRDWDREARPLSALKVHSQYNDQPLKTDDGDDTRARIVPVHPELEEKLRWWWGEGFELTFARKPTQDDFIVPHAKIGVHSKSSAYKAWRRSLDRAGVENKTLHATRHTFISIARSNGARKDVLEKVTHNAAGETIDGYTTIEWWALCEAVVLFDLDLDRGQVLAAKWLQRLDSKQGEAPSKAGTTGVSEGEDGSDEPPSIFRGDALRTARFDANQRRLLKLAEADPEQARPGLAFCAGYAAALSGDLEGVEAALRDAADALGVG